MMIDRLFHVCITVSDIEAALEFYCAVLGLESIGKLRNERAPGAMLGFPGLEIEIHADHLVGKSEGNASVIDLIELVRPRDIIADIPFAPLHHARLNSMAFDTDDVGAIYKKLKARGDIAFLCAPQVRIAPDGVKLKVLRFNDPFGNLLEAIEHVQP